MNSLAPRMLFVALLAATQSTLAAQERREALIVFAAASLTDALQRVSTQYTQSSGVPVKASFAASSALARQIESGARADVFLSADPEWMNYLDERQLIRRKTREDLLGNRLVLIAPSDSAVVLKLAPDAPLLAALGERGRLATGDPDSVPAGKYARSALDALHLWDALQPRLARAENVRVALMYVARGEAPLGIVYATDAAAEPKVRTVDVFPETSHPLITYPVAVTTNAGPDAASFVNFLRSDPAQHIFIEAGFQVMRKEANRE